MLPPLFSRLTLSVLCLGSRIANAHNSNVSNKFANDGSFLQQFLKLQKAQTSTGECSAPCPISPPPRAPPAGFLSQGSLSTSEMAGPTLDLFLSPLVH